MYGAVRAQCSARLQALLSRCSSNFGAIEIFRGMSLAGPPVASGGMYNQSREYIEEIFGSTPLEEDPEQPPDESAIETAFGPDYRHDISTAMTHRAIAGVQASIDAASLVFAHSVLDEVASECCEILASVDPESWSGVLMERSVKLREIKDKPYFEVLSSMLSDHIAQLRKESLSKRLSIVNQKCQPVPAFILATGQYSYDPDRLKTIDDLRHDIIHKAQLDRRILDIDSELAYVENTCYFLAWLIVQKHRIPLSESFFRQRHVSYLMSLFTSPLSE